MDINQVVSAAATVAAQIIAAISAVLVAVIAARANGSATIKRIQQLNETREALKGSELEDERRKLKEMIVGSVNSLYKSSKARNYFVWSLILFVESVVMVILALSPQAKDIVTFYTDVALFIITFITGCIAGGIGLSIRLKKDVNSEEAKDGD